MADQISIELKGAGEVLDTIRALLRTGQDMRPAFDAVGSTLLTLVQLGFRKGTDPYGAAWPPPKFRAGQPLRDTGRLQRSFVYDTAPNSVIVGTNVCYAPVHQFGAKITAGKHPHPSLCGYYTLGSPFLRWPVEGGGFAYAKSVTIPPRPMLPDKRGMPGAWSDQVLTVLKSFFLKKAA